MFRKKPEYILLHARYAPDGRELQTVRFVRHFGYFTWDWQLMDRATLVELLRQGRRVHVGWPTEVVNQYRSGPPVELVRADGQEFIRTDRKSEAQDRLEGAPIF